MKEEHKYLTFSHGTRKYEMALKLGLDILHGTRSEKSHQTWIGSLESKWNIHYQNQQR